MKESAENETGNSQQGILYHITTSDCLDNIWGNGIDPAYSQSKFQASWFVTKGQINWAVCHVAYRHDCKLDDIWVCAVLIEWKCMRRTAKPGRYYTTSTFKIENASPARWFIDIEDV